jgi:SulP family sulfate permease
MSLNVLCADSIYAPLIEITRSAKRYDKSLDNQGKTSFQRITQTLAKQLSALYQFYRRKEVPLNTWISNAFPIIQTIKTYPNDWKNKLLGDLISGISIAMILIPQSLSYSIIAGLPSVYGLYASIVPMAMYSVLGTCHQLAVGPVAVVSIVVGQSLANLTDDKSLYPSLAITMALLVGIFNLAFGIFNLGFLMRMLSPAFISAFVTGSAFSIGSTQISGLLGYTVSSTSIFWQELQYIFQSISHTTWLPPLLGIPSFILIILIRKKYPRFPIAFIVMTSATLISYFIYEKAGNHLILPIVGKIPQGMPSFVLPSLQSSEIKSLIAPALIITFIGYMESYSLALKMGEKHAYRVKPNQEFIGLGVANVIGSCFQSYPVTGSFSRTAESDLQGAQTILYSVITVILMIIALTQLTSVLFYIPKTILSAVIISAVYRLIHFQDMLVYYKQSTSDFLIWWVTLCGVMIGGTENGLAIGVGFSFALVLWQQMFPYIALIGEARLNDGSIRYLNIKRFPQAAAIPHLLIFRFDASLIFLNKDYFHQNLLLRTTPSDGPDLSNCPSTEPKVVILEGSAMHHIDASGAAELLNIVRILRNRCISVLFVYLRSHVKDVLIDGEMMAELNPNNFYLSIEDAIQAANTIINQPISPVSNSTVIIVPQNDHNAQLHTAEFLATSCDNCGDNY